MYTRTLIIELNKGDVEGITNVETRGIALLIVNKNLNKKVFLKGRD